jgi:heme exporter protein B
MNPYLAIVKRDLRLSLGRGSEGMTTLFFFVVTASLFPFALGGEQALLQRAAAGIIWVSAVLASLLSLETIYHRDEEDGTLDLMMMSPVSPVGIALAKMLAHWAVSGLPLVLAGVIVAQMLFLPPAALTVLVPSLLLGTVYMSLLGGMGAVLTFGARRPGLLLALLVLPLYIPMLILGVLATEAVSAKPYLLLQLSLVIAALPLTSWAAAICLRMNSRS